MTPPIVFLDTETTGLHPTREAWEVGMIKQDRGVQERVSFFVDYSDLDMATADPFALNIGKFWERHPDITGENTRDFILQPYEESREAITSQDYDDLAKLPVLLRAVDAAILVADFTRGAHIVGAVPSFDTETLDPLLRKHNQLPGWHYHLTDVETLAIGYLNAMLAQIPGDFLGWDRAVIHSALQPPWSSRELGKILGVEQEESTLHTALGDAQWACDMYTRIFYTR